MVPGDRDDHGRHARVRREATRSEVAEGPAQEAPAQDPAQAAWGNAALVDLAGLQSLDADGNSAALRALRAARRAEEADVPAHGGDPDPIVDAPLQPEDFDPHAAVANPPYGRDGGSAMGEVPVESLPDEDTAWLEGLYDGTTEERGYTTAPTPAEALQPSVDALRDGLGPWLHALEPWWPSPVGRLLLTVFATPAPCLHDPHGRPVFARARAAAAATALASEAGELARYLAEIAATAPLVDHLEHLAARSDTLPSARSLVQRALTPLQPARGDVAPAPSPAVRHTLERLIGLPRAVNLVPHLPSQGDEPSDEAEDPLGLDRFLDTRTHLPDPESDARRACLQAAERMAGRVSALGARLAGAAIALIRATPPGRSAPGRADLLATMQSVDAESHRILHLVLDVADAARRTDVPAAGLRNGLRHAARAIDRLHDASLVQLAQIGSAHFGAAPWPHPAQEPDPLTQALAAGQPDQARPWLQALPDPQERELALVLLDALVPLSPARLLDRLRPTVEAVGSPLLRGVLRQLEGACLIWLDRPAEALALAHAELAIAAGRRDGARVAAATLLAMEAHRLLGDDDALHTARDDGGWLLQSLGASALTLLARWRPPTEEPADRPVEAATD